MKNKKIVTILSLLIMPMQLLLNSILSKTSLAVENENLFVILYIAIAFGGFMIIIFLNRKLLHDDFAAFKEKILRNILIAIVCVALMHGLLYLVRLPIKNLSASGELDVMNLPLVLGILMTMTPLLAPFVEETVFRHHLFYKFQGKTMRLVMFIVSSVLFGLIHYNNFNGNLVQLIPYMFMGAFFNVIYLFSKNIWYSITTHFIFNLIPTAMGVIGLVVLRLI